MRVLIADDSKTERLILSTRLRKWGYEIVLANDGDEALAIMLAPDPPRIAILDWIMPGITGPEIAKVIREKRQDQYIYLILVTALGTKTDIIQGLQAGADDYITKPVHNEELRVRLRSGARLVRAWNELERSEKRTDSIINSAGDSILMLTPAGTIQFANPAAETLSGFNHEELTGKVFFELLANEADTELVQQRINNLFEATDLKPVPRENNSERLELNLIRNDGEAASVLLSIVPMTFEGEPAVSVFMTDISERKRLEVDLRHAQKMEAVGQLAAGIAHEINTPIQFISDSVTYLKESSSDVADLVRCYQQTLESLPPNLISEETKDLIAEAEEDADLEFQKDQLPKAFNRITNGLERVTHIVGAMKEFARKDASQMTDADINQAIRSTLTVATNEFRYCADIEMDLGALPLVHCNIGELNQVFLNLIVNAAHAIADVNAGTTNRGVIHISSVALDEERIEVRFKDTGGGIPKSVQKRVFDPFFTTKEVGRGSGQGLSISHAIVVEKHAGEIFFETEEGVGTTFFIRLPTGSETPTT